MIEAFRSVLVTGASSGIGRATTERLRAAGLKVLALGRNRAALAELADRCGAIPLVADVRDTDAIGAAAAAHGIDVLINNAGVLPSRGAFQDSSLDDIDQMVEVNLKAPLRLTRSLLPSMIERKRGHIFFVGSSAGRTPHPGAAAYGATKAGISLFSDALRADLVGTGVRVTEIAPGRVETDLYRTALGERAQDELYRDFAPIRAAEIAELIEAALAMPLHVDVSRVEVFPSSQVAAGSRTIKVP